MKPISNLGLTFLAVYLLMVAITALIPVIVIPSFFYGLVALFSAIFILMGK